MHIKEFAPTVGTLVKIQITGKRVSFANFEAFSSDFADVLVSVAGHPKQHVGSDRLFWVPVETVTFMC